tara:strand:+ start:217 stop:699 length:483 start_codon:yes stop_codon:yes gene_type:complete
MEDLAAAIIEHLKLDDGPGPFALTYTHRNQNSGRTTRWLVLTAARVNSRTVYEVCIAEAEVYHPHWHVITYADVRAAATFAIGFLEKPEITSNAETNLQRRMHHVLDMRRLNHYKWKASETTRHLDDCFEFATFGSFVIMSKYDLQAAMLTLMPISTGMK